MLIRRHIQAFFGLAVLGFAIPPVALAADSGYSTVDWVHAVDTGEIAFVLSNAPGVYYKVNHVDLIEHCRAILLTGLSTAREVKAFYTLGTGSSTTPFIVTTCRIH